MANLGRSILIGITTTIALGAGLSAARRAAGERAERRFFADKHVVITGGSRGLGYVVARRLLAAGAKVTICGRSQRTLDAALEQLSELAPHSIAGYPCDVGDETAARTFITQAQDRFGPVDVLVNNAGIIEVGPFADQTLADYRAAMDTHFWGPLYTMLAVLPAMRARRSGRIANVASIGGMVGVPHLAPYSASKFAQIGLTQALAAETAQDGVVMTSIVPGLMRTGSPDNASFKGRHRAEYAWFTLSDANPLLSVSASAAARRVLRAVRRGEAQAVIGITAQAAKTVNALWPEQTSALLRLAAALLPAEGGSGTVAHTGAQSHSGWTENPLTALDAKARDETNQRVAIDGVSDDRPDTN